MGFDIFFPRTQEAQLHQVVGYGVVCPLDTEQDECFTLVCSISTI
jgi:hypothetical protein